MAYIISFFKIYRLFTDQIVGVRYYVTYYQLVN